MSTKKATTDGKPKASGTPTGANGRNVNGKPILGEIEELGDLIYKQTQRIKLKMYICITEKLA